MTITRRNIVINYIVPVCLFCAFALPARAKNTLTCTVVDETGKPIAKQEFSLTAVGSTKASQKKTGGDGVVKFTGVDDGSYTLGGEVPGYVNGKSAPIEVSGNKEQTCKYTIVTAAYANSKLQEITALLQTRKFKEGAEAAKVLVEQIPSEGATHYLLAMAYANLGDDQAGPEIKKAAELNPKFEPQVVQVQMQALNLQADQAKRKGDFADAIKRYQTMLAISPNNPTAYYNLAVTYAAQKNYPEALKNIDLDLAVKPDDADAKRLREFWQKQFDDELKDPLKK